MQPLHDLPIGLLQKFSNQQDNRRSSITGNIILCCRSPGDHNLCHVSKRCGIDLEQGDSLRLSDFGFAAKVSILAKYLRGGKAHHFPKQHISILGQFDLFLYPPIRNHILHLKEKSSITYSACTVHQPNFLLALPHPHSAQKNRDIHLQSP